VAGSVTLTSSEVAGSGGVRKYSLAWVSDAAGAVSGNAVTLGPGTIVVVEFVPDSGGTQPTDLYDVTAFNDPEGTNMFNDGAGASIGADLSNTAASHKVPFIGGGSVTYVRQWLHGGAYTLVVAAAGNAKGGTVHIYVMPVVL
jgi:hypothetical protein